MAIIKNGENVSDKNTNAAAGNQGAQAYENNNAPKPNLNKGQKRIGLKGIIGGGSFLTNSKGSEYTTKIGKIIEEAYNKSEDLAFKPEVMILDKEADASSLSFSVIVVSALDRNNNTLRYFNIVLGATGQAPLTAGQIHAEMENYKNSPVGYKPVIYTIDDTMNSNLTHIVCERISQRYNIKSATPIDGVVVHDADGSIDTENIASNLAILAYNSLLADIVVETPDEDLDIASAKHDEHIEGATFAINTNLTKSPIRNIVGDPVRADWKVQLSLNSEAKKLEMFNVDNPDVELTSVTGYIEAIPMVDPIIAQQYQGRVPVGTPINDIRLKPQLIITDTSVRMPTVSFALLNIITALVMTEKDMYVKALFPAAGSKKNHVGYLNRITKVNNSDAVFELASNKYSENDVANAILSMFTLDPVLSMDIQNFGPQASYTAVFAKAAQPLSGDERENEEKFSACRYIIETANVLTNGNFPSNFDINNIFADQGIVVPLGYYSSTEGLKDIRDIDLAFIVSQTGDEDLAALWAQSSVLGNTDNFITKVNIISQLCKDAVITNKAIRVTFTNDFLTALSEAAKRAGLVCRYKMDFTINPTRSINVVSNYFDRAGLGNGRLGFLNYQGGNRSSYTTRLANTGYTRW